MAQQRSGSMVDLVVEDLRRSESEGIAISNLFAKLIPDLDESIISSIWQDLVQRDDVYLDSSTVNSSPLTKLSYQGALSLGLGSTRLRTSLPSVTIASLPGDRVDAVSDIASNKREADNDSNAAPAKKRRGRPPKPKTDVVQPPPVSKTRNIGRISRAKVNAVDLVSSLVAQNEHTSQTVEQSRDLPVHISTTDVSFEILPKRGSKAKEHLVPRGPARSRASGQRAGKLPRDSEIVAAQNVAASASQNACLQVSNSDKLGDTRTFSQETTLPQTSSASLNNDQSLRTATYRSPYGPRAQSPSTDERHLESTGIRLSTGPILPAFVLTRAIPIAADSSFESALAPHFPSEAPLKSLGEGRPQTTQSVSNSCHVLLGAFESNASSTNPPKGQSRKRKSSQVDSASANTKPGFSSSRTGIKRQKTSTGSDLISEFQPPLPETPGLSVNLRNVHAIPQTKSSKALVTTSDVHTSPVSLTDLTRPANLVVSDPNDVIDLASQGSATRVKAKRTVGSAEDTSVPKEADQSRDLQAELQLAERLWVTQGLAHFPCKYKDEVGNLVLSADQTTLEFVSCTQFPPQMPLLMMDISALPRNPVISAAGSDPMELRIKNKALKGEAEPLFSFVFCDTPEGIEAASSMRASIVKALDKQIFQSATTPAAAAADDVRPYRCDGCESRFKNLLGLKYHLTKSQTACNPNYDISTAPQKKRGRKPQSFAKKTSTRQQSHDDNNHVDLEDSRRSPAHAVPGARKDNDPDANSAASSDDSVVEWFIKHATQDTELPPINKKKTKVKKQTTVRKSSPAPKPVLKTNRRRGYLYKSLPNETAVVQSIIEIWKTTVVETAVDEPLLPTNITIADEIAESALTSVEMDEEAFEMLLMTIITHNFNMFSADKSLWFACIGMWLKNERNIGLDAAYANPPKYITCCKALDNLVAANKLEQHKFKFSEGGGRGTTVRHYFITPDIEKDSPRIDMMKELIRGSCPGYYIPSQFAPPQFILDKLQAAASPAFARAHDIQPIDQQGEESSTDHSGLDEEIDQSEYFDGDDNQDDAPNGSYLEDAYVTEDTLDDFDLDSDIRHGRLRASSQSREHLHGGQTHPYSRDLSSRFDDKNPLKPLFIQTKTERAAKSGITYNTWWRQFPQAHSFMQSKDAGAWDQHLDATKRAVILVHGKRPGLRRPRLQEPITYLQSENGTWSVIPVGYGVNHTYSWSSKKAHAKPDQKTIPPKVRTGSRSVAGNVFRNLRRTLHRDAKYTELPVEGAAKPTRISTRTGKPVRSWVRRGEQTLVTPRSRRYQGVMDENDHNDDIDYVQSGGSYDGDERLLRRHLSREDSVAYGTEESEVGSDSGSLSSGSLDSLNEVERQDVSKNKEVIQRNPGLYSLPSSFGLNSIGLDRQSADNLNYLNEYSKIEFLAPIPADTNSDLIDGSWTLMPYMLPSRVIRDVRWDDQTSFTVESLPYESLAYEYEASATARYTYTSSRNARRRNARHRNPKATCSRPLTQLPNDFEGLGMSLQDITKEFNVQVADPNQAARRRQRNLTNMNDQEETRFIITVVVIRTLTGGLDQQIDWVLISTIFSKYAISYLSRRWNQIAMRMKPTIERLGTDFREPFLAAYEIGEIPPINYDNLCQYNWTYLVDWVMENVDTHLGNRPISIPNSRDALKKLYHYSVKQRDVALQDTIFNNAAAVYKRIEDASAEQLCVPLDDVPITTKIDEHTIARSWVRVIALTPDEHWDLGIAKSRLDSVSNNKVIEGAIEVLVDNKVIVHRHKNRVTPGRSYEATDVFSQALRKTIREPQFMEAVIFKRYLDDEFGKGTPFLRVDYFANEGIIMALTSMQAAQRIRLVPVNVPLNKFGLTDGGYETRKVPKERLRWEMDMYPTESYLYDGDNTIIQDMLELGPPRGKDELIPIWWSVNEQVNANLWKRILIAIGQTLALRAGLHVKELTRILKPALEEWEVRLLVDWGTEIGLWRRLHPTVEGWMADEWWWLGVGLYCVNDGGGEASVDR